MTNPFLLVVWGLFALICVALLAVVAYGAAAMVGFIVVMVIPGLWEGDFWDELRRQPGETLKSLARIGAFVVAALAVLMLLGQTTFEVLS